MELVAPSVTYKDSFIAALKEYQSDQAEDRRYDDLNAEHLIKHFAEYVESVLAQSRGEDLPEGYVPATVYWLVDDGEFIGKVSIRHSLNEHLLREGGHIGYDIRPTKRRMGYGKKILELALPKAKAIGIPKALVTCNETNIGSKKIIEANGGVLENAIELSPDKPKKLRYWVPTS